MSRQTEIRCISVMFAKRYNRRREQSGSCLPGGMLNKHVTVIMKYDEELSALL